MRAQKTARVARRSSKVGREIPLLSALLEVGRCLTHTVAEVIELGPAHLPALEDFYLGDLGGVNLENTLNPFAVGDLANREGRIDTTTAASDDNSLEDLDTLFTTLHNARVHIDGISLRELGNVFFHLLALDFINHVHGIKR